MADRKKNNDAEQASLFGGAPQSEPPAADEPAKAQAAPKARIKVQAPAKPRAKAHKPLDASALLGRIDKEAGGIRTSILKGAKPSMQFPVRSLQNVKYQPDVGFFELKGKKKERTLTVSTVKTFAQTLKMMSLSKELVRTDDIAVTRGRDGEDVSVRPGAPVPGAVRVAPPRELQQGVSVLQMLNHFWGAGR